MTLEGNSVFAFGSWELEAILRLVIAAMLGAVIGLEREHHGRAAGLRTHLLVALGASMAMVVSIHFARVYGGTGAGTAIRIDPARVAYGVMGGIGFLGGGAIIRHGAGVRGLTTAASLWCTAAIGLGAGFGMFGISLAAAIIVLFALAVLDIVDHVLPTRTTRVLTLNVPNISAAAAGRYVELLRASGVKVVRAGYTCDFQNQRCTVMLRISARTGKLQKAFEDLASHAPEITFMKVE